MSMFPATPSFALRSSRVVVGGDVRAATVVVKDGTITDVLDATIPDAIDVGDLVVSPGVVDSHVHINEPGRTEWEGFLTATQAAAAGGITCVVDMPLNCIPATTSLVNAEEKAKALRDQLYVDVAFWGGVIPGNAHELAGLARFGVPGAKCFTCPSGVDEFPHVSAVDLDIAMPILRDTGTTLLVHAEAPGPLDEAEKAIAGLDPQRYDTYLRSRPNAAEDEAVAMIIALAEKHRCPSHIVHLASASALSMLRDAQARGVPITAETCLHYLTFAADEIDDGDTPYKCAPPIRDAHNRALLWEGVIDGTIAMVVSDHSPCTPQLKQGSFMKAWGGIAGLQLGLSALFTQVKVRNLSLVQMSRWHSEHTAKLAGVAHRKGKIAVGFDADLVIWDDAATHTVDGAKLHHKHKLTPWAGRTLDGVVHHTIVGGRVAYSRADGLSVRPLGSLVTVPR